MWRTVKHVALLAALAMGGALLPAYAAPQAARNLAIRVNLDDGSNRGFTRTATLAARLADLESAGLLERSVLDTRPPRTEYALTAEGSRLAPLLEALTTCSRDRRPG